MKLKLFFLSSLLLSLTLPAQTIREGKWVLSFDTDTKKLLVEHDGLSIVRGAYASAKVGDELVNSFEATMVDYRSNAADDCFGKGTLHELIYTMPDGLQLIQQLAFYDGLPYFVTRLSVTQQGKQVASNYLSPLCSTTANSTLFPNDREHNRMLWVPWDNDGFITYACNYLNKDMFSYSVTAIYNSDSRFGVVTGAVDHDTWKNAVHVKADKYYRVQELGCISGYTDAHSHDSIQSEGRNQPHGTVVGDTVSSARFMFGVFDDWRTGLETFGQACTRVVPRREWDGGVPYGWSSWGVQSTDISYQGIIDCADFIRDNLVTRGFHDEQGRIVLSLDAWWNDNLTSQQVTQFVKYCQQNNMIPGLYYGSFCRFGDLESTVPGTSNKYKFRDIALKQNGHYKVVDGAYCLDPTHPGTKMFIMSDMQKFRVWGIKYLKCDFQSNGAIEADSWYNKKCYTGIQAYNEGMAFLLSKAPDDMYIDLSISPAFPYQYAHGRRISCDAWGQIGHSKYVMQNASYGWWLNKVYYANDPDHMVMAMRQEAGGIQSEGANRARLTTGAIVGAYLSGDNFSPNVTLHDGEGKTRPNYYETSCEKALQFLTNEDVNEIPRTCHSFRPVEGSDARGYGCEDLMTFENANYVYVAAFNFKTSVKVAGTLLFSRLGISASDVESIKELWTGETISASDTGFGYEIPASDARIYRIAKVTSSILDTQSPMSSSVSAIYDLSGRKISTLNTKLSALPKGIYISNGKKFIVK